MKGRERKMTRRVVLARALKAAGSAMVFARWPRARAQPPLESGKEAIWDSHCHLSGVQGTAEQRAAELLKYADRLGIERLAVSMGVHWSHDPLPDDFRQQNDDVLRAVDHGKGRILGFVLLNPKHSEASLAELDRCIAHGPMVGVKLWVAMKCSDPRIDPIIRRTVELKVPVLQHTYFRLGGNLVAESSPDDLAILAARHPDATFISAHTGNDWEQGVRAIRASKNIWTDISGCDPTAGMVEMAVRELGAERVLYGSDAGGRSFASQLAKVYGADVPSEAKRLILGSNFRRMLEPILQSKGMPL